MRRRGWELRRVEAHGFCGPVDTVILETTRDDCWKLSAGSVTNGEESPTQTVVVALEMYGPYIWSQHPKRHAIEAGRCIQIPRLPRDAPRGHDSGVRLTITVLSGCHCTGRLTLPERLTSPRLGIKSVHHFNHLCE